MKKLLIVLLLCAACGGKLTDEQRKKLHEGMATQDIKRVTPAELQEAALTYGKKVLDFIDVNEVLTKDSKRIDSLSRAYDVRIYALTPSGQIYSSTPSNQKLNDMEKNLVDAYIVTASMGETTTDNFQKMENDSILITRPAYKTNKDGSKEFLQAVGVKMSTRTVVLSMPKP